MNPLLFPTDLPADAGNRLLAYDRELENRRIGNRLLDYGETSIDQLSRMGRAIDPMRFISERDVAAFLPGAGMVEGYEQMGSAARRFREGDYLGAAGDYALGAFNSVSDVIPVLAAVPPVTRRPANADEYIQMVSGGKRIAAADRPNLGMGDMYGMAPRGARPVARLDGGELGPVRIVQDGTDFYALARNPDLGETDVVGYIVRRGDETELAVVNEAQGRGIGSELSYLYRRNDPMAPSGGFTEAGERAARRTYERLVREGRL